jgi:hypothetical protein
MAATLFNLGKLSRSIEIVREALAQLRPGDPLVHFDAAIALAAWSILYSGRWSEINEFMPALEDIWEQIQHDVGATTHVAGSYLCVLHIALAREGRAAAEAAVSLEQVNARALLAAYREDDPRHLNFDPSSDEWTIPILTFLNDRGIPAPRALIARLSVAIDEAETHGLSLPGPCLNGSETVGSSAGWRRPRRHWAREGSCGDWPGHP